MMKAISLFSGMGGDSLGIQNAGVELVVVNKISTSSNILLTSHLI